VNTRDPKLVALLFNECINNQDVDGLARLMTEDHTFIDREGEAGHPRDFMIRGWKEFFRLFPEYRNTFTRVQSSDNCVVILGSAFWSEEKPFDPVIWTATIVNDLVQEWRIYDDIAANRKRFSLL
jgi:hypothetical protein